MDINRKTAYNALMDVESKKAYSNLALNHQIKVSKPNSPAFVRELVYGVLERKLTLDYYLDQLVVDGIDSLRKQELTILRMGLYQLGYMDSVPEYAGVSESVALAKKYCKSKAGLVNGVLREYLNRRIRMRLPDRNEDEIRYLSIKYSYAPWIIEKWLKYYKMEFVEQLLEAGNQRPPMTIRLNWLKIILLLLLTVALVSLPFAPFLVLNARRRKAAEARKAFLGDNVNEAVGAIFQQVVAWLEATGYGAGNRLYRDWAGTLPDSMEAGYPDRFSACAADFEEAVYSSHSLPEEKRERALALLKETEDALWRTAGRKQRFRLKYWMCLCE